MSGLFGFSPRAMEAGAKLAGREGAAQAISEVADPASVLDNMTASAGQKVHWRHLTAGG